MGRAAAGAAGAVTGMDPASDTIVLDAELAYADVLPIRWTPLEAELDVERAAALIDQNLRVLQTFAAMEDSAQVEKPDEDSPHSADLQRISSRSTASIIGRIGARTAVPKLPIASARGAGGAGARRLGQQPRRAQDPSARNRCCSLCAYRVAAVRRGRHVKVDFDAVGEPVADIIEKLAFRRHRRQVAKGRSRPA